MRRMLSRAVWLGTISGLLISLAIGAGFLVVFFKYASNLWANAEALWEAVFQLIACILMTIMAFAFLKSDELTAKWHRKLHKSLKDRDLATGVQTTSDQGCSSTVTLGEENDATEGKNLMEAGEEDSSLPPTEVGFKNKGIQAFFWIPFVTVLREGLEGMVFVGGIGLSESAENIPLAAITGLAAGFVVGFAIYKAGNSMKLHTFFVSATILILYLSAGLLSKSVGMFEIDNWNKMLGTVDSDEAAYYRIDTNVWHLDCCNPEDSTQGGWAMFSAIFGWTNNATIGTVTSYCLYWLAIAAALVCMKLNERRRERLGLEKIGFKKTIKGYFARSN
ncbi:high-affinity iron permease [Rhizoclosmatium hyalinum]|nr:high-affinity iron permease [Rhizoclosmatium hyalinum]